MKNNIELYKIKIQLKLNKKDFVLLVEAFRRKNCLDSKPKFLGLGSPSNYKSKLFKPSFGELPGVDNWYQLTELGSIKLKELESLLTIDVNNKQKINELLFVY